MTREERKIYNYNQKHRINGEGLIEKQCSKCNEWKPMNDKYFYKWDRSSDGYQSQCSICVCEDVRARNAKNPELDRQRAKSWYERNTKRKRNSMSKWFERNKDYRKQYIANYIKENPDKGRQYIENHRKHDISTKEWKAVQDYFNYICAYCGKTLEQQRKENNQQFHKEHVDHIGYNDVRNCVPACSQCNSKKRARTIDELFESGEIETFTQDKYNKIMQWCNEDFKQYIEEKPPYKITRKQNKNSKTYHFQLWTVDEFRNMVECIAIGNKKKDLKEDIEEYLKQLKDY